MNPDSCIYFVWHKLLVQVFLHPFPFSFSLICSKGGGVHDKYIFLFIV